MSKQPRNRRYESIQLSLTKPQWLARVIPLSSASSRPHVRYIYCTGLGP
jgi:hypothetical protein